MNARTLLSTALLAALLQPVGATRAGDGEVTLIHTGDIHGHLVARTNVRSDSSGRMEGGLARMYTVIEKIRKESRSGKVNRSLLINTGDTVQGSGEALFTRGQAMIDVLNLFNFDAHAPGNWDFLYGTARFEETFKGSGARPPVAPWGALAANLYYTNQTDPTAVCAVTNSSGARLKRVLPAYTIKQVGKVKVGILGFTTARAIAAVGTTVTAGYQFTDAQVELPCYIGLLRNREKVDLLVMISELEMSRDIQLAENHPGVDVILNSDMHERTVRPIVTSTGTVIVEEGQDGTMLGELEIEVEGGKMVEWEWTPHIITDKIAENKIIRKKIAQVRKPFLTGSFKPNQQVSVGGNTTTLRRPVDEIIAYTNVDLHRSNFVTEELPGVVEGSSHDLIADAMRWAAGGDAAALRGFRYGTNVPAGSAITMQDIFHFIPIAAKLGRSPKACGADLKFQVEQSSAGVFNPDPTLWAGGWMFGYSNVSFDLDACDGFTGPTPTPIGSAGAWTTFRGKNIAVSGVPIDINDLYTGATQRCASGADGFKVAGYWYADDPITINNCHPCRGRLIQVVTTDGRIVDVRGPGVTAPLPDSNTLLDVTEAVVNYLRAPAADGGLDGLVSADNLPLNRVRVTRLPTINPYPFNVIQPLRGASAATCPPL